MINFYSVSIEIDSMTAAFHLLLVYNNVHYFNNDDFSFTFRRTCVSKWVFPRISKITSPTLGTFVQGSPIEKIRASLKHVEDKRNTYLTQNHVIGKVSSRKADLAYEMVHVNFRHVNFKWQLGYKIGKPMFIQFVVFSDVQLNLNISTTVSLELLGQSNSRFKIQDPRSRNQAPRKQAPV